MKEFTLTREMRQRAGHQGILGETLAKFEFFQHGWHPYSRFLDIDKVDLILRRRHRDGTEYREIQVKFGKLYECTTKWELPIFSHTSWRFFTDRDLATLVERRGLFLTYVLSPDDGFKGDMFIFPICEFVYIVKQSEKLANGKYRVYISSTAGSERRWYVRRRYKFDQLNTSTVIDVSTYYRNFRCLD